MTDHPLYDPILIDPSAGRNAARWSFLGFVVQCFGLFCLVMIFLLFASAVRENRQKIDAIMKAVKAEGIDPEAFRAPQE